MKILLSVILALLISMPAQADNLKPPGWSAGNNKSTGNVRTNGPKRTSGNEIRSRDEEMARKAKISKALTADRKAQIKKNASGTTSIQNVYKTKKRDYGSRTMSQVWSDLFN